MRLRHATPALFLVVGLGLAGGGGGSPSADPTSPPAPSTTSTPTADPVPPALADLVVSPEGLGTLVIGQPPSADPATAMIAFDDDICISPDFGIAAGDPLAGGWAPNAIYGTGGPTAGSGGNAAFQVSVKDGALGRIDVDSAVIRTSGGLHIGDARSEVLTSEPSVALVMSSVISEVYRLTGTAGVLDIEVAVEDASMSGYWPPDELNTIRWMRVLPAGTAAFGVAGSDNVIFGCGYTP